MSAVPGRLWFLLLVALFVVVLCSEEVLAQGEMALQGCRQIMLSTVHVCYSHQLGITVLHEQ
jgi:hypothetical protein